MLDRDLRAPHQVHQDLQTELTKLLDKILKYSCDCNLQALDPKDPSINLELLRCPILLQHEPDLQTIPLVHLLLHEHYLIFLQLQ